ncbi:MAG TPA: hypothetical protein VIK72_08890 [Clostridiaceae bacterium]
MNFANNSNFISSGSGINNESSLHKDIKKYLMAEGDIFEGKLEGYIIDIIRGDSLIEIQTKNFSAIRNKLRVLLEKHKITLVYPIYIEKLIIRYDKDNNIISRRKSPKKGTLLDIFNELIRIPDLLLIDNLKIQLLVITVEEKQIADGKGSWRRKGVSIVDRTLISVRDNLLIHEASELLALFDFSFDGIFSTKDFSLTTKINITSVRKIIYCLNKLCLIKQVGKTGNLILYSRT